MVASSGEDGKRGKKKAATVNNIGAVSPAALSRPKMTPVNIPGRAWGITILLIVCHLVAPTEILTVLKDWGTARSASSVVLMMTGKVMIERVSDPARMLVPNCKKRTNNPKPKRP
jgi:hypothetical protein